MKKISMVCMIILLSGIAIGCARADNSNQTNSDQSTEIKDENSRTNLPADDIRREDQVTFKELIRIYEDNKETINRIKDGLLASKYNDIGLYYMDNTLICREDPKDRKLASVQDIQDDAIDFFNDLEEGLAPEISVRNLFEDSVVEIKFYDRETSIEAGIIYTAIGDELSADWMECEQLEDHWYAYRVVLDY